MPDLTGDEWLALQLEVAIRLNANARGIAIEASQEMVQRAAVAQAAAQAELKGQPEGER